MVIIAPAFVAASVSLSPALQLEAKAVRESEWWSTSAYSNKSHCQWNGIKCNDEGSVTEINMGWVYVGEKYWKFNFSSFPNLVRLDLYYTGLRGSIPVEIGTLSKLTYLDLSWNSLTGELPLSLTNLTQLVLFDISVNLIIGKIPSTIGLLTNLESLDLSWNQTMVPSPLN